MQIKSSRFSQDSVQFDQTFSHHHKIRHHLISTDELMQGTNHIGDARIAECDQIVISLFGVGVPVPGVLEGSDLGLSLLAAFVLKQNVIRAVRVERRIEVDQVHALVVDVIPQYREVIAVEEGIGGDGRHVRSLVK